MSGERGGVDDSEYDNWIKKLPEICESYEPKDILNMDETGGVFLKCRENVNFVVSGIRLCWW